MKKETLKWRLGKLPTVEELRDLVKDKIVTNDEAREILFNKESEEEADVKTLKEQIKFLEDLVKNLSRNQSLFIQYPRTYQFTPWMSAYTHSNTLGSTISLNAGNTLAVSTGTSLN